ncbi:MAG: hypothetical protein MI863_15055 [Desulfobacterales bacterium]|nr:hypothetical protein [Desulfobacterales bacterium]
MPLPNKKGWLAIVFILVCLAIPFCITYYVSTDTFRARYAGLQGPLPEVPEGASLEKSRTMGDQVLLVRGERIRLHNTSLIYRGIENDEVILDLFLEELDHDHAYPQKFSRDIPEGKVIRFGDVAYTVKAVSQHTLVLKIHKTMGTQ